MSLVSLVSGGSHQEGQCWRPYFIPGSEVKVTVKWWSSTASLGCCFPMKCYHDMPTNSLLNFWRMPPQISLFAEED